MSVRPLPRSVKQLASRVPVLIAPVALGALGGCATSMAIVDDSHLSDIGAHYVAGSWRHGTFRYEIGSALPGAKPGTDPRPYPVPGYVANQAALAAQFVARSSLLEPTLHAVIEGVPEGVRKVEVQRLRSHGAAPLTLRLAVRYVDGDERYARGAVRRIAHEAAHLAAAYHHRSEDDEEWAAAVIESCAERAVFGTTRGYVFRDELAQPPPTFDRAQRTSVLQALRATRQVERAQQQGGSQALLALCDEAFERIRPR